MSSSPAILSYGRPRRRLARVPLLFRARDCEDEDGIFALSYGKRVGLVHTRSGATGLATMADESGMLLRVPSDWPRLSWEMTTAGTRVRTLLGEPPRTNLVLNSGTLDAATWSKSRATVSANADIGPDGTLSADRLVEASVGGSHRAYSATVTITANGNVCVSRFVKAGTRSWVFLGLIDATEANAGRVYFDLGTGTKGSTALVGTGTVVDSGIEAWGNGWYRCWVVVNLAGGITTATHYTGLATGDGGHAYAGDGASYLILGGAQVEDGALVPSSYIPTGATAVTRAADSMYLPYLAVPREMTAYVKGVDRGVYLHASGTHTSLHIGAQAIGTDPRFRLGCTGASQHFVEVDGGVTPVLSAATLTTAPAFGDTVEHRAVLSPAWTARSGISVNGGTEQVAAVSGVSAAIPSWADDKAWLAGATGHIDAFAFQSVVLDYGTRERDELRELVEVA